MKKITAEKLVEIINAKSPLTNGLSTLEVSGVSIDSRNIQAGECFFALKGENADGHDFIEEAFEKHASCAVIDKPVDGKIGNLSLTVDNTIEALGNLARWYRRNINAKVVAITGSAGKTTTREIVFHILNKHFNCHSAKKSFNNAIGLPLTILGADEDCEVLILELGSNHPGEITYLSGICEPDIAMITNIYPAHLEGFGDIEGVLQEKTCIIDGLRDKGKLLINGDFENLVNHFKRLSYKFVTFGEGDDCDVRATNLKLEEISGSLTIDGQDIRVPLAGRANLSNTLTAWAICREFGISIADFAKCIASFNTVQMRVEVEKIGSAIVINDCYNANPASMANALDFLAQLGKAHSGRRLVFVCGPMLELGPESREFHRQLGEVIAQHGVALLLATGPDTDAVAEAAKETQSNNLQEYVFENTDSLCNNLERLVRCDDIILVKGSRVAKLEKAVSKLKELFVNYA